MKRRRFLISSSSAAVAALAGHQAGCGSSLVAAEPGDDGPRRAAAGPLRAHPDNPRYFTDGSGRAVYLAGWNVWSNLQDGFGAAWEHGWGEQFDFDACLDDHARHNLNYIRLWLASSAQRRRMQ